MPSTGSSKLPLTNLKKYLLKYLKLTKLRNRTMSASGLTYLITGANRGIGLGLLQTLVARPNTTVIAAVRDTAASSLKSVSVGQGSKLISVKLDASVEADAAAAAKELQTSHGITKVDVLISNAGILDPANISPVAQTPVAAARKHIDINALGPLALFQAFLPLLEKSSSPKFLSITSSIGSIGGMEDFPVPFFAYGVSKATQNYLVRKIAFENPKLVSIAYNPGWVQTDMGNGAANGVGMDSAPLSIEDSVAALITQFDAASLDKTGSFIAHTGEVLPW